MHIYEHQFMKIKGKKNLQIFFKKKKKTRNP